MRPLSAPELLDAWEQGLDRPFIERALAILAAACPETPREALARFSIGQRNGRLLQLRTWTFGPQFVGLLECPHCGERLELTFQADDLRAASEPEPPEILRMNIDGAEVQFRLPNSLDLAAIKPHQDLALARQLILERCLLKVQYGGQERPVTQLPANVAEAVVEHMAKADPQADIRLDVTCSECGHEWQASFDIGLFFWAEINAWANHTLDELHLLASAYGWSEKDILAMSPKRRQLYLDRVTG